MKHPEVMATAAFSRDFSAETGDSCAAMVTERWATQWGLGDVGYDTGNLNEAESTTPSGAGYAAMYVATGVRPVARTLDLAIQTAWER